MCGRILFNGNGGGELIDRAAPFIRGAAHGRTSKVMLVTAAWGAEEFSEAGIRRAL